MDKKNAVITSAAIISAFVIFIFGVYPLVIAPIIIPDELLFKDAERLESQGDYAGALQKYQELIDTYPHSIWVRLAYNKLDDCNYGYMSSLIAQEKYDDAMQVYMTIMQGARAHWSSDNNTIFSSVPANVMFDWGTRLREQNATLALFFLGALVEYHPNSEYRAPSETAIVDTVMANVSAFGYKHLTGPYSQTPAQLGGNTEITVINDTPNNMVVLLKGEVTKRVCIAASPNSETYFGYTFPTGSPPETASRATISLPPGTYQIVFTGNNSLGGLHGEQTWSRDTSYDYWIYSSF